MKFSHYSRLSQFLKSPVLYRLAPLRQLVYTQLIYQFIKINQPYFQLQWKENLVKHQNFSKCYDHDCLQNFLLYFMSLLTVSAIKNSHILRGTYFIFLKEGPTPNSKNLQNQIWASKKRSKKQLLCKANFSTFLQLSCSNFKLELY